MSDDLRIELERSRTEPPYYWYQLWHGSIPATDRRVALPDAEAHRLCAALDLLLSSNEPGAGSIEGLLLRAVLALAGSAEGRHAGEDALEAAAPYLRLSLRSTPVQAAATSDPAAGRRADTA